ncbi:MAG: hypothetical protein M1396_02045 [Chloroflexi bacterium]|nr:hypothetical protein [Chloroflexota bacterium]
MNRSDLVTGVPYQRPLLIAVDPPDPSQSVSSYGGVSPHIITLRGKRGISVVSGDQTIPRKMPHTGGGGTQRRWALAPSWWVAGMLLIKLFQREFHDRAR